MKAKEYLQQLQRLDVKINQKIKELDDLRIMSRTVSGIDYSRDRVQISPSNDASFTKIINQLYDLENEINREIDTFVDAKHLIINQIQALNNVNHVTLLFKRYIEYKNFEQVAVEMNFTIRNIYFIHGRALQNFERMFLFA